MGIVLVSSIFVCFAKAEIVFIDKVSKTRLLTDFGQRFNSSFIVMILVSVQPSAFIYTYTCRLTGSRMYLLYLCLSTKYVFYSLLQAINIRSPISIWPRFANLSTELNKNMPQYSNNFSTLLYFSDLNV